EAVEAVGLLGLRPVDDELDQEVLFGGVGRRAELHGRAAIPQRRPEAAGTGFQGERHAGGETGGVATGAVAVEEQHRPFGLLYVPVEGRLGDTFDVDLPAALGEGPLEVGDAFLGAPGQVVDVVGGDVEVQRQGLPVADRRLGRRGVRLAGALRVGGIETGDGRLVGHHLRVDLGDLRGQRVLGVV